MIGVKKVELTCLFSSFIDILCACEIRCLQSVLHIPCKKHNIYKKILKNLKKVLDILILLWYNIKSAKQSGCFVERKLLIEN